MVGFETPSDARGNRLIRLFPLWKWNGTLHMDRSITMPNSSSDKELLFACIIFTRSGSIADSAKVFGMGKASALRFIDEVMNIIIERLGHRFIFLPRSDVEWNELSDGFESICGFPDTCLAVDGTLIEIERPLDFEGWYCRKGYPAINLQGVVDYKRRFRSFAMRPGAENDKGVFSRSDFGRMIHHILPRNKVIVADAGYQLLTSCLTPYEIHDEMAADEKHYNYLHSCTRIVVENAFGILKNRFRRFKVSTAGN